MVAQFCQSKESFAATSFSHGSTFRHIREKKLRVMMISIPQHCLVASQDAPMTGTLRGVVTSESADGTRVK